jgi:fructokinase
MLDLLSMGDMMIDFTPAGISEKGNPLYEQNPGGAPANVCVTVSRLGGKAGFLGKVGDEIFGHFLEKKLDEYNIDKRGLSFSRKGCTKLGYVTLDSNNDRSFYFVPSPLAEEDLTMDDIDKTLLDDCKVFLLSTVSQYKDPIRKTSASLIEEFKRRGTKIAYDPNWNCAFSFDPQYERDIIRSTIARADIVKISHEEFRFVYGDVTFEQVAEMSVANGAQVFVVTCGSKGCYYKTWSCEGYVPAYRIRAIDTTGAGDAFMGGLLFMLTRQKASGIECMPKLEIEDIMRFASACGAICAMKRGAMPSVDDIEEVYRFTKQRRNTND